MRPSLKYLLLQVLSSENPKERQRKRKERLKVCFCFSRLYWSYLIDFSCLKIYFQLLSSIYLLKAQIHESLENRPVATDFYKASVCTDLFSIEAFRAIVQHEMLTADDEKELISSIDFACKWKRGKLNFSRWVFQKIDCH